DRPAAPPPPPAAPVPHRAHPPVPPCHPPRGQRHLPGLRTVLGAARHRGHPLGEHAVPHHRPVVAGPVPRAGPGGGGPPLCRSGGAGAEGAGPVQRASVNQESFVFGGVSPLRRRVTFWTPRKSPKN